MTTYTIKHTDGSRSTEHDSMDEAIQECERLYGTDDTDIELGDEEPHGMQDEDGGQPMCRLVWASEDDAEGDDGARAVASIRWTE